MFNLQGSEIVIVLLLALVVLGPEKLPDAMRKMGEFYAELKKMSSGFQSEFRAAIDEPMREVRDTANVLRDSADLTKLQNGERDEKPKSAEMAAVADPEAVPADSVSDFDRPTAHDGPAEPELAADSKPAPFSGLSSAAPTPRPVEANVANTDHGAAEQLADFVAGPEPTTDSKPAPFSGQSSAAPRTPPDVGGGSSFDDTSDQADPAMAGDHDAPAAAEQQAEADDATGQHR